MQIKKKKVDLLLLDSLEISFNVVQLSTLQHFLKKNIQNNLFANGLLNFGLTIHKRLKSCYFSHPK
jgi:hypothetical protein